ncbi:Major cell-surface adhesin PAc precursor [Gemmata obscuriglobus]|uniref:Uncharacterized protein n=1 Tax=Gemmata obscuriglobus TaxID=114 RepID=A0A2Z3GXM1_9BACT|nr:BBP7 family outer membrane beta-barrel protein [Gemmata obscuriglobus]AWM39229.1 hypothetical protein C1280_21065 [Gemmata obscuriglobus]QEG27718.1 Major cell-surface adhesin PAc precursor [Gemmata obscuriglobus]VTS04962.1 : DUF1551 [Gemmata obscuriglobus UQM 2246]
MRSRWPVAVGVVLVSVGVGRAQPLPPPALPPLAPLPVAPPPPPVASVAPTPPTTPPPPDNATLPPLLPVPPVPPLAEVPKPGGTPPPVEYDPNYLYLPEREPERPRFRAEEEPGGKWWGGVSLGLAWADRDTLPATVRLPVVSGLGGAGPGLMLPVAGRSTNRFDAALGLEGGRRFGAGNTSGVDLGFFFRSSENSFDGYAPGVVVLFPQGTARAPQLLPLFEPLASMFTGVFPARLTNSFVTPEVNYRHRLYGDRHAWLDALAGYRFAYLKDELFIGESDRVNDNDDRGRNWRGPGPYRVSVANPFHGGQIGLAGHYRAESGWYVAGSAKVAFGAVTPEVRASGLFTGAEGLLGGNYRRFAALDTRDESRFAVMPVVNVSAGWQFTPRARAYVGYSFQYLSRAGRLSNVLDPAASGLKLTDFSVQSVNLGLEIGY